MTSVNAVLNCLFNTPGEITDIPEGVAYGLKGSYDETDCSISMVTLVTDTLTTYESVLGIASNLIQPYYDLSTMAISSSNAMVACSFNSQMA